MSLSAVESALPAGEDPVSHARLLRRVRDATLGGGRSPSAPRPVIGASWRRVRSAGLDPAGGGEVPPLDPGELHRRRSESGLATLMPVLRQRLLPVAEASGQILVVVDPAGRVLWREGGAAVSRRADALGFVEGSAWDEPSVGTNAIGTALVVDAPVHVYAAEHYAESHQPWTCAAAPLHDPVTGRLLGAVDLSGPAHTVHPSTIALVDAVCRLACLELLVAHERRTAALRALAAPLLARLSGPALVVDLTGVVVASTGLLPPSHVPPPVAGGLAAPAAPPLVRHAGGLAAPERISLPASVPAVTWLPGLGRCTVEPLPGGWLLRVSAAPEPASSLVLDLRAAPRLSVTGPSGSWESPLTTRHAEILLSLARSPDGRTAAQLATDLFGDPTRTVTVRAEISRLRRTLGSVLTSNPYRLTLGVALRLPDDPANLLPPSTAPAVEALRA